MITISSINLGAMTMKIPPPKALIITPIIYDQNTVYYQNKGPQKTINIEIMNIFLLPILIALAPTRTPITPDII